MTYNIYYSDPSNPQNPIVVPDGIGAVDNSTSLTFPGKNSTNYGSAIGTNFLRLLENFARNTAPGTVSGEGAPIKGQLWYDTSASRPQLKLFDGVKWTEAGNIKKGSTQPNAENSIVGDLWVDTTNQQLYLFAGTTWILVGPQFSEGSESGIKAETLIDRNTNTNKTVLILYVSGFPVIIVSKDEFIPKLAIDGFEVIRQGINLSTADFDLDGTVLNKFWGTSEKANSLVVGTSIVPSTSFLRGDTVSTTNYTLNIRNGGGLVLGSSLETSLSISPSGAQLYHKTPGQSLIFKTTTTGGIANEVLVVTGNQRVGVNKAPTEALDVSGNLLVSGSIKTTATTSSSSSTTGALVVGGGAGIAGDLHVGGITKIVGQVTVGDKDVTGAAILTSNETPASPKHDIGTSGNTFKNVYAQNFYGAVTGTVTGNVTGNVSGSAVSLAKTSAFSLRGDVTSNVIAFNGASAIPIRYVATLSKNALGVVTATTTVPHEYISGYIVSLEYNTVSPGAILTSFITAGSVITVTGLNTFTYTTSNNVLISTTGVVGTIAGSDPWTGIITGMSSTAGLVLGSTIIATNSVGSLGSGGTYTVSGTITSSSVVFTAISGTTPVAGTITSIIATGSIATTSIPLGIVASLRVNPGGTFNTVLDDEVISGKTELSESNPSDYFLVYRPTATPALRKINLSVLLSTVGAVPTGSIMPFAGDTAPSGYLLCDGSEQSQAQYPELFIVLSTKYGAGTYNAITNPTGLKGVGTFRIPDLRGRFALGKDDMDNGNTINIQISLTGTLGSMAPITTIGAIEATFTVLNSATVNGPWTAAIGRPLSGTPLQNNLDPVTITAVTVGPVNTTIVVSCQSQTIGYPSGATGLPLSAVGSTDGGGGTAGRVSSATILGVSGGATQKTLTSSNIPDHLHDMKDSVNNQYGAVRSATGTPVDPEVIAQNIHFTSTAGQLLTNSGGIKGYTAQTAVDVMNPYQTINYIIFTGRIIP
jgi:microcystin-dependent protein